MTAPTTDVDLVQLLQLDTVERMTDQPDYPDYRPVQSVRGVAKMVGLSPTTVMKALRERPGYDGDEDGNIVIDRRLGLDGKVRPSRRFDTTDRDARIRELRADGKSMRAIADEVRCSVGTVHRVLSR